MHVILEGRKKQGRNKLIRVHTLGRYQVNYVSPARGKDAIVRSCVIVGIGLGS